MTSQPPWQAAPAAELEWVQDGVPHSRHFDDFYHSSVSGLEESRYVFLRGNKLPERWLPEPHQQSREADPPFTLFETGFGTGLNFLCTWQAWRAVPGAPRVRYIAVEKYPLRRAQLQQALERWPELSELVSILLDAYPPPLPGRHRIELEDGRFVLDLVLDDVLLALEDQLEMSGPAVNAWYLDGFTPARNPDMWSPDLFRTMAELSEAGSSFATFTAASDVRRSLQSSGFAVERASGFGQKREMLYGYLPRGKRTFRPRRTAWHLASSEPRTNSALVIGAGLAGANTAAALARRGWQVTVLEQNRVASAASGNGQGVLYTRISHRDSALNSFSLHSYSFALRYYQALFRRGQLIPGQDGEFCGAFHLLDKWDPHSALASTIASLPELARYLPAGAGDPVCGIEDCPQGLFFPGSGWLDPAAVCHAVLSHPNIHVQENCGAVQVQPEPGNWQALDTQGNIVAEAPVAIIATGASEHTRAALDWLPVQRIRGQVTHLPAQGKTGTLSTVICHDGYLPPARLGIHCIGATFDIADNDATLRWPDHQRNLDTLYNALPGLVAEQPDPRELDGRVGFRCASPDYLPMVGPVPHKKTFMEDYAALRKNAKRIITGRGSYVPGLYLSTAHGSRGLTSTPLCAELLANQICAETPVLAAQLEQALSPSRFLIRELIRNRVPADA